MLSTFWKQVIGYVVIMLACFYGLHVEYMRWAAHNVNAFYGKLDGLEERLCRDLHWGAFLVPGPDRDVRHAQLICDGGGGGDADAETLSGFAP